VSQVIVGTVRIWPLSNRHHEVLEILHRIHESVLAQPGCAASHIYVEESPGRTIALVERWESEAALEAHMRSDEYRLILGALEFSSQPPEIYFDYVSKTEDIKLIERVRL